MEQLGSHCTDFHEIRYLGIFRKSVEKIEGSLKSEKNKRYLTRRPIYIFLSYVAQFFLEWETFQTKVVEKIKTHILWSVTFFFENRAVYEIMWKNTVERGRPQITIWRMRIACWISKVINTLRLCNTHCFSTSTMVALTPLNVTLYVHRPSCYF
jgi:hypothetical protein